MRIELEIEELVLRGFDARDRYRIVDAIERELSTHVTRADLVLPPGTGTGRFLHCGSGIDVAGATPSAIGKAVRETTLAAFSEAAGHR